MNAASPHQADESWRRFLPNRKQALLALLGLFLALVALVAVGYVTTGIPEVNALVKKQTTHVYYSDGRTELGRIGGIDRTNVALSDVPKPVQQAVLAAEDQHYYSESGISPTGILRALWTDVRGGEIKQGGSTITQQYAKNAYLTQDRTFTRKIKEIFIAVKLDRTRSKDRVLQDYLNTIYFGRGAYGIEAASQAYFGHHVKDLNVGQGAVLAGLIRSPGALDPAANPSAAQKRWHQVIDAMVKQKWLSAADAKALHFPDVKPPARNAQSGLAGPTGFVIEAVKKDLADHGFSEARLNQGGYRVVTTIDKKAQDAAVHAEESVLAQHRTAKGGPLSALVAVQPGTGAVRAMYGGQDFGSTSIPKSFVNLAYEPRQPGSSFKPYTLVAALDKGMSLRAAFDGTSPKHVPGYGADQQVSNDSNEQCPYPCTLVQATADSINTVFVPLAIKVGPDRVRQTAYDAGVARTNPLASRDGNVGAGITLGIYDVRPIDQAVGYATIAAGGQRAEPYLVGKVLDGSGHMVYQTDPKPHRAFDQQVAANATYALEQVLTSGTAAGKGLGGRPAAGKTGTTSKNADAWFVGFTPQLSAAVWMGNPTESEPLTNVPGYEGGVYGGGLPATIWQQFMNAALQGEPVKSFPQPTFSGSGAAPQATSSATASPTATPSASPSSTSSPTSQPTQSPTQSPTSQPTQSPTTQPTQPAATQSPAPSPTATKQQKNSTVSDTSTSTGTSPSPSPSG